MKIVIENRGLKLRICIGTILFCAAISCGTKCPKVITSLSEEQIAAGDIDRVNRLVAKRKEAIEEASRGESATKSLSRLQFSVTAYELAIQTQLRVIKISPKQENAQIYAEKRAIFDEMRCQFDELVAEGTGHEVSDPVGRDVQQWSKRIEEILKNQGRLSSYELRRFFEEGIGNGGQSEE